jgi:hypothetical protein
MAQPLTPSDHRTCVDIRDQREFAEHGDDPDACLHIVAGHYDVITGAAPIDSILASVRVETVLGNAVIGSVRGSASIKMVAGTAKIGCVCDGTGIGHVRDRATVGCVRDSGRVGLLTDDARIGSMEDWSTVGSADSRAVIGTVRDFATVGDLRGEAAIRHVTGAATVGRVGGHAVIGLLVGSATVQRVEDAARVTAAGTTSVHAYGGVVRAAPRVAVFRHSATAGITGGVVVDVSQATTDLAHWAVQAGVEVRGDTLLVYRSADDNDGDRFTNHPLAGPTGPAAGPQLACAVPLGAASIVDEQTVAARAFRVLHSVDESG